MPEDALQSFLSTYGAREGGQRSSSKVPEAEDHNTADIPERHSTCCCGNPACAYLQQNQASLDDLEQDVRHAAKLGQVCGTQLSYCFEGVCAAIIVC